MPWAPRVLNYRTRAGDFISDPINAILDCCPFREVEIRGGEPEYNSSGSDDGEGSDANSTCRGCRGGRGDHPGDLLEPMDAETYRLILRWRQAGLEAEAAEDAEAQVALLPIERWTTFSLNRQRRAYKEFSEAEMLLRQDFVRNKAVWCGEFWRDLWYFLSNNNPVLAVFYSHKLHPISRRARLSVYALSVVFVAICTVCNNVSGECVACGIARCVPELENENMYIRRFLDNHYPLKNVTVECNEELLPRGVPLLTQDKWRSALPEMCCDLAKMDMFWFKENVRFGHFEMGARTWGLVVNMALSITCFQLMMCGCVQASPRRVRLAGYVLGRVVFLGFSLYILWRFEYLLQYYLRTVALPEILVNVAYVKAVSWSFCTLFNIVLFSILFVLQRPKQNGSAWAWLDELAEAFPSDDERGCLARSLSPRFNVHAPEYLAYLSSVEKRRGEKATSSS